MASTPSYPPPCSRRRLAVKPPCRAKVSDLKAARPRGRSPRVLRIERADPLEHLALTAYVKAHFDWMRGHGVLGGHVRARKTALRRFIAWCEERALRDPKDITKAILERYQRHLFYYRKANGRPMTLGTQFGCLAPLKTFFKWLAKENHILYNPASEITLAEAAEASAAA